MTELNITELVFESKTKKLEQDVLKIFWKRCIELINYSNSVLNQKWCKFQATPISFTEPLLPQKDVLIYIKNKVDSYGMKSEIRRIGATSILELYISWDLEDVDHEKVYIAHQRHQKTVTAVTPEVGIESMKRFLTSASVPVRRK